jgi:hypothetical protein
MSRDTTAQPRHQLGRLVAAFHRTGWRTNPRTGCRIWRGSTNGAAGYGIVVAGNSRMLAHRLALTLQLGREIRPGMLALHSCDTALCVNPSHLREGTARDNMRDRLERTGYFGATLTHCARGHEYTKGSHRVQVGADGHERRQCLECVRVRRAARRSAEAVAS